jgi:acetoin utilization deacetylase AcuC-like enzyme
MAGQPVFLEHPSSLDHDTGAHPERAARLQAILRELDERGGLGYERLSSTPVERSVLGSVHPVEYIAAIEELAGRGGGQLDLDTVMSAGSFTAAVHAAGGAVQLVDLLLDGQAPVGFSAHRPPGHHASQARAMGFCLFNNVAVAARYAIERRGLGRVMIVDWDVHHGNGTSDIFFGSDEVLFVSIHQSPLYPGTGAAPELGSGGGRGFTVNLPVPPHTGDAVYLSLVEHVAVPLLRAFEPGLLLISAGYDAHAEDPLAECRVTEAGFAAMTTALRRACAELAIPVGCVLEGGYALGALARSVIATLEALAAPLGREPEDGVGLAPLAAQAQQRLAPLWPAVG